LSSPNTDSACVLGAMAIQEFKELILKRYGIALTDTAALEQAGSLLRLYKTVYGARDTDRPDADQDQETS
jgi:hypothetical protein